MEWAVELPDRIIEFNKERLMRATTMVKMMALLTLLAGISAAGVKNVAVVETEVDPQSGAAAKINKAEVRLITAGLRKEAVKNLPRDKYNIMTSETVMAQGGAVLEACADENCVITLGSKIGADYIVRGTISKLGTKLTVSVEMFETDDGNLVASSDIVSSEKAAELLEKAVAACGEMFRGFVNPLGAVQIPIANSQQQGGGSAVGTKTVTERGNFKDDVVGIEMVFVKGGTFKMGCTSEQGSDCSDDEKPVHNVTVSDFYIGKYEVTQNQWVKVMGSNPSYFKGGNLPVERVSWNDVQEFILKLNSMTGKKYRLPTEAEWEYASRGGAIGKGYKYSGSNNINYVAWYNVNSGDRVLRDWLFKEYIKKNDLDSYYDILESNRNRTRAVGTKSPNELGIYDMSGNVSEWVSDWYGSYSSTAQTNPVGPHSGSGRVTRGGDWGDDNLGCRVSDRSGGDPTSEAGLLGLGFRLVLSSP
jgi:formylglycine-generating enzyme required for sulfatase activity